MPQKPCCLAAPSCSLRALRSAAVRESTVSFRTSRGVHDRQAAEPRPASPIFVADVVLSCPGGRANWMPGGGPVFCHDGSSSGWTQLLYACGQWRLEEHLPHFELDIAYTHSGTALRCENGHFGNFSWWSLNQTYGSRGVTSVFRSNQPGTACRQLHGTNGSINDPAKRR